MIAKLSFRLLAAAVLLVAGALLAEEPAAQPAEEAPTASPAAAPAAPESASDESEVATTPPAEDSEATSEEEPEKEPQLVPGATSYDAGAVRKGERIRVEFALENRGEADLLIRSVQPSCGCTVASFTRKIEPGESGKVEAWVDTSALQGDVVKYLTVSSNDPATPRLQLAIKASVAAFVTASPSYARVLQVQSQPPTATTLLLWSDGEPPLDVLGVDSPEPWVEAAARPASDNERRPDGPAAQWLLEVRVLGDAPAGALDDEIVVRTNHPRQRIFGIPLSGFVRPVVQAVPAAADFGRLDRRQNRRRFALKVHNFGPDAVAIESVTCDLPFAKTSVLTEQEGRRYRVEIDLSEDAPKGKFHGEVEITTSSSVVPKLTVPVRGHID